MTFSCLNFSLWSFAGISNVLALAISSNLEKKNSTAALDGTAIYNYMKSFKLRRRKISCGIIHK